MDWLDQLAFLRPEELLRYFCCNKSVMSSMENPGKFLRQLRDYDLIPEETYTKVCCMKTKENMKTALYDVLDWVERERSQSIPLFWRCVFKDPILKVYPTLRLLRNSLMDGSFKKAETDQRKRKELTEVLEEEEEQGSSVKKKKEQVRRSMCEDDEEQQPGPSSQLTPSQRKKTEKVMSEEEDDDDDVIEIWDEEDDLDNQEDRVPYSNKENSTDVTDEDEATENQTEPEESKVFKVTCGGGAGTLHQNRFASGSRGKCIRTERSWLTPIEFLKEASSQRGFWKKMILCEGKPLFALIEAKVLKIHPLLCECSLCKPNQTDLKKQKTTMSAVC